jgi:ribosomal protein L37AE/L43A
MPEPEPRGWSCKKCGYLLGIIAQDSSRVTRLSVLRRALVDLSFYHDQADDPFSVEELSAGVVRCSHCGNRQEWYFADAALDALISKRKARKFGLEDAHV